MPIHSLVRALRPSLACTRRYSSVPSASSPPSASSSTSAAFKTTSATSHINDADAQELRDALFRKRKTDWKRRQGGQNFLDHLIVNIRAGRGGDGCVAFHREKFVPYGPPSGGNGGRGGDVYIQATPHLTTLSSVPRRVRGAPGGTGQGTWQNGRGGAPFVIKVPLGTVVRELPRGDPRRQQDEWEAELEGYEGLEKDERRQRWRERRWVHYPESSEDNIGRGAFREAEWEMWKAEREVRRARREREESPLVLDLDRLEDTEIADDAPLALGGKNTLGTLVASGGAGGFGNPHFLSMENRSPKWATRGYEGERVTLELELKLLADVGLVGVPNAGKSTLLRALTAGRAKSEVAGYAFTTLNPVVGVVRVAADGALLGGDIEGTVHDETWVEEQREKELMQSGAYADARTRNQARADRRDGEDGEDAEEVFRFTIADNPGLISQASENVGLGHSFLRSMERSLALVYVVDFSAPEPWEQIRVLREELEKYKPGMSAQARMVVANKADLLAAGAEDEVQAAREKLLRLEEFVRTELAVDGRTMEVVPTSGKYSQNIRKVARLMKGYVKEARAEAAARHEGSSGHVLWSSAGPLEL